MKALLLIVLCASLLVGAVGCVTAEQQRRLNDLTAEEQVEIVALAEKLAEAYAVARAQTKDIKVKIEDGTVTAGEGKDYLDFLHAELSMAAKGVQDQINATEAKFAGARQDILDSGKSKAEYWGGIVLAMILNAFGLNAYRNRKHPLTTPIG